MPRSHVRYVNNIKDQDSIFSPEPKSHKNAHQWDLYTQLQGTEVKRKIINLLKEFKELKEDTKKDLKEIKENELKDKSGNLDQISWEHGKIQKWGNMKKWLISINHGEQEQANGIDQVFNKLMELSPN